MSEQNESERKKEEMSERDKIIHVYRVGRSQLEKDEIKSWEDPEFSIYDETDRYGFIHENKLPARLPEFERKLHFQENSRLKKWLKMIQAWDQYYPHDEKLRQRIYKGIPDALRGKVWPKLLNVDQVKQQQEGVYERMLEYGMEASNDIRQIDLDVNRTYRNHRIFRERYNIRQQMLFKVLVAYSVYNTEVGYCQGMSQIAALLLMYMDEEDAFWCLSTLMSQKPYRMHGFFIPGFPKLLRFSAHHDKVIKKFLPRVAKHFSKFNIDSTLYTLKWFFQCFLDRVPFSLTLRIWDVFLLEGEDVLTGMSYTLLKLHKRSILQKPMEETIQLLQIDLEKDFGYHDDSAITELQKAMAELRKHKYLTPGDTPEEELPSKEFGSFAFKHRINLADDRSSLAGSILLRPETFSIATSRTSDADSDSGSNKISLYDNVSINESIEAAKARSVSRSQNNSTNSHHKSDAPHQHHQNSNNVNNNNQNSNNNQSNNSKASGTNINSPNHSSSNHQQDLNESFKTVTGQSPAGPSSNLNMSHNTSHSSEPPNNSHNTSHTSHSSQSSHNSHNSNNSRAEQTELIEKIAKLNHSASSDSEQVFIQKSEKTFIVADHRHESVVTKEFTSTKSTFISVNNFTVEDSSVTEHGSSVEPLRSTPIRINTVGNGSNGKIETLQQQPTSPSKIRIFVPYPETNSNSQKDSPSPNSTAKGLPAVET